jgi:hypothetical protein
LEPELVEDEPVELPALWPPEETGLDPVRDEENVEEP